MAFNILLIFSLLVAAGAAPAPLYDEECGDGYTCDHDGDAYGCSKISSPIGTPMVCCSEGQSVADCNSTSSPLHPLPPCPYGGATGPGCIRSHWRDRAQPGAENVPVAPPHSVREEECGPGYTCSTDGDAYGCVKIGAPRGTPMVCCSAGMPLEACYNTSSPLKPLPWCPYAGATGAGCIRFRKQHQDSNGSSTRVRDDGECGAGYVCSHSGQAYGCVKANGKQGEPMVCCSSGQAEAACNSTSSPLHPLPYCPYGGATGGGCVRFRSFAGLGEDANGKL